MWFRVEKERILYEDREILAYHKPAGLAVQSARPDVPDLESLLLTYLSEQERMKEEKHPAGRSRESARSHGYLAVINRLDQPVEGIVLFAKSKSAAAALTSQLNDGRIQKEYLALCCVEDREGQEDAQKVLPPSSIGGGNRNPSQERSNPLQSDSGGCQGCAGPFPVRVEHILRKDARTNTSAVVPPGTAGAKPAQLDLMRIDPWSPHLSLVRIHLITGRHHQIRVQMAAIHMPLFGDRKYNPSWETYRDEFLAKRSDDLPAKAEDNRNIPLCLCAVSLDFIHPRTRKQLHLEVKPSFA